MSVPTARASGQVPEIVVDTRERYPWRFDDQQATTTRGALRVGDSAVHRDDRCVAVVERKSLADLVSSLTSGKLRYLLAELATMPRAAVVGAGSPLRSARPTARPTGRPDRPHMRRVST